MPRATSISARLAHTRRSLRHGRLTLGAASIAALVVLNALVLALSLGLWKKTDLVLPPDQIRAEQGLAWMITPIPGRVLPPFTVRGDTPWAPAKSSLKLWEGGKRLGPPHSPHATIREAGNGAFSHWSTTLYFSTSDGSDPRNNGRRYSIDVYVTLHPLLIALIWLATGAALFLERHRLAEWLPRHGDKILIAAAGLMAAILALVALDKIPPLNEGAGPAKDWPLVRAIMLHLVYGGALFAATAVLSVASALVILRSRSLRPSEAILTGYPAALVLTVLLAACALTVPYGRPIAAAAAIAAVTVLAFWKPPIGELKLLAQVLGRCAVLAASFAAFMALLWHGPTATLPASTMGDLVHSSAALHMLAAKPYPLWHLGSEGDLLPYDNMTPMVIGAALFDLPRFDGLLFLTASVAMFFGLWLALALASVSLVRPSAQFGLLPPLAIAVLVALVAASTRTPSFVVESPPISFMLPLLFSTSYLAYRYRESLVQSALTILGAAAGVALSKVVLLVPLGLLAGYEPLTRIRTFLSKPWHLVFLALIAALIGVYAYRTLATWLPPYIMNYVPGPASRVWLFDYGNRSPTTLLPVLARDLGWCVLCIAVARLGEGRLTAACWGAVAANFFYPYLFEPAAIYAPLLVVAAILLRPELWSHAPRLLAASAALLLPYPLSFDWAGALPGVVWVLTLCPIAWLAIAPGGQPGALARYAQARIVPLGLAVAIIALIGVGGRLVVVDSQWRRGPADVLTPAMHDIWAAVSRLTPPDALIFTDQTGPEFRVASGWNSYAATSQRQIFISSWVTSFRRFRVDPAARAARLADNEAVLAGTRQPGAVPLARTYSAYFAVMDAQRKPPPNFERVYGNRELALYRIAPRS